MVQNSRQQLLSLFSVVNHNSLPKSVSGMHNKRASYLGLRAPIAACFVFVYDLTIQASWINIRDSQKLACIPGHLSGLCHGVRSGKTKRMLGTSPMEVSNLMTREKAHQ